MANPFESAYSLPTSTNDVSYDDLEPKDEGFLSSNIVMGNEYAQNTAQRGEQQAGSLKSAYEKLMSGTQEYNFDLGETGSGERVKGWQQGMGTFNRPAMGEYKPNTRYGAGGGSFTTDKYGNMITDTTQFVSGTEGKSLFGDNAQLQAYKNRPKAIGGISEFDKRSGSILPQGQAPLTPIATKSSDYQDFIKQHLESQQGPTKSSSYQQSNEAGPFSPSVLNKVTGMDFLNQ